MKIRTAVLIFGFAVAMRAQAATPKLLAIKVTAAIPVQETGWGPGFKILMKLRATTPQPLYITTGNVSHRSINGVIDGWIATTELGAECAVGFNNGGLKNMDTIGEGGKLNPPGRDLQIVNNIDEKMVTAIFSCDSPVQYGNTADIQMKIYHFEKGRWIPEIYSINSLPVGKK